MCGQVTEEFAEGYFQAERQDVKMITILIKCVGKFELKTFIVLILTVGDKCASASPHDFERKYDV